jgi:hypothetical protein
MPSWKGKENGLSQTRVFGGEGRERRMTNISLFESIVKERIYLEIFLMSSKTSIVLPQFFFLVPQIVQF